MLDDSPFESVEEVARLLEQQANTTPAGVSLSTRVHGNELYAVWLVDGQWIHQRPRDLREVADWISHELDQYRRSQCARDLYGLDQTPGLDRMREVIRHAHLWTQHFTGEKSPLPATAKDRDEAERQAARLIEVLSPSPSDVQTIPHSTNATSHFKAQPNQNEQHTASRLLLGWDDILQYLHVGSDRKEAVKRLNTKFNGPIKNNGQGSQPIVNAEKLARWWNDLAEVHESSEDDGSNQDANLSVSQRYQHGTSEVVPEISGHVKKRRSDRRR